jgi:hypothetical protein
MLLLSALLLAALAAAPAAAGTHTRDQPLLEPQPGAPDTWSIPDMQQAPRDAPGAVHTASLAALDAAGRCGAPLTAAAACPALIDANKTSWWTGNADRRNAFLMSVLMRDNYPMAYNLGPDGDETPPKRLLWQCLLRSKWMSLGADRVEFYESDLSSMVVVKAGNSVFANMRGTWTQAHRDNNMEWVLSAQKKMWNAQVRYHSGWGTTAEDSYSALKAILKDFGIPQSECKLWLSGHSRGGGAALLTAAFADGRDGSAAPCKVEGVWTFGSVKPFDSEFVKVYNEQLGAKTYNWWNQIDVVSCLLGGWLAGWLAGWMDGWLAGWMAGCVLVAAAGWAVDGSCSARRKCKP